jgi:hypothetical protein
MLNEHAYESASTVIVKTVCYGRFSGGDLGGGKLKATFKSFRARAISVLELNEQSQILACAEYYERSTMPIGIKRLSTIWLGLIKTWPKRSVRGW